MPPHPRLRARRGIEASRATAITCAVALARPLLPSHAAWLAVYQNGVRINEAFGETVNWDLVPDFAVSRATLVSGNPVYGLNALGGSLALEMKSGFTFDGVAGEVIGGSFGRIASQAEYGARAGNFATYVGARGLHEEGWRDHSPSSVRQLYADLGGEKGGANLHLSLRRRVQHDRRGRPYARAAPAAAFRRDLSRGRNRPQTILPS